MSGVRPLPLRPRARLALLACLALMACQGGTARQTAQQSASVGAAVAVPASLPAPVVTREQGDLLAAINAFRSARGRAPLEPDPQARLAAERHARDLRGLGELSHVGSDGSTVGERVSREGMAWCRVAENLARGQSTAEMAVNGWSVSPGHRRNLLGDYTLVGTARNGEIWVAVFVKPC